MGVLEWKIGEVEKRELKDNHKSRVRCWIFQSKSRKLKKVFDFESFFFTTSLDGGIIVVMAQQHFRIKLRQTGILHQGWSDQSGYVEKAGRPLFADTADVAVSSGIMPASYPGIG